MYAHKDISEYCNIYWVDLIAFLLLRFPKVKLGLGDVRRLLSRDRSAWSQTLVTISKYFKNAIKANISLGICEEKRIMCNKNNKSLFEYWRLPFTDILKTDFVHIFSFNCREILAFN